VLATGTALYLGAWSERGGSPRPLARRLPYANLACWLYNDITGELLLRPATGGQDPPGLAMTPLDGYQFLAQIRKGRDR
jgi:hypothetical protein